MPQTEILEIIGNAIDRLDNTLIVDLPRWAQKNARGYQNGNRINH